MMQEVVGHLTEEEEGEVGNLTFEEVEVEVVGVGVEEVEGLQHHLCWV